MEVGGVCSGVRHVHPASSFAVVGFPPPVRTAAPLSLQTRSIAASQSTSLLSGYDSLALATTLSSAVALSSASCCASNSKFSGSCLKWQSRPYGQVRLNSKCLHACASCRMVAQLSISSGMLAAKISPSANLLATRNSSAADSGDPMSTVVVELPHQPIVGARVQNSRRRIGGEYSIGKICVYCELSSELQCTGESQPCRARGLSTVLLRHAFCPCSSASRRELAGLGAALPRLRQVPLRQTLLRRLGFVHRATALALAATGAGGSTTCLPVLRAPAQARRPTVPTRGEGHRRPHYTLSSSSGCASSQSTGGGSASALACASACWRAMAMAAGKPSQFRQSQPNLAREILPWIWCSARCKPAVNISGAGADGSA